MLWGIVSVVMGFQPGMMYSAIGKCISTCILLVALVDGSVALLVD
jgi:hypothetical protein